MSSNEMENEADNEIPAKRMKISNDYGVQRMKLLSKILLNEIDKEIQLRVSDLENIEENIFLTKKSLLKVRQGVVSDYYKQKNQKEPLQYPHHPAIQDTIIGKRPRQSVKSEESPRAASSTSHSPVPSPTKKPEEKQERKTKGGKRETREAVEAGRDLKPPCRIQPKLPPVEAVKPSQPRGYISKKQIRIVVGNVSKWLAPEESTGATHKWTVYTKTADPLLDLTSFVSKVVFFLHPSYKPNDIVPVTGPPFKLTRRGWGEFPLKARFHFKNPLDNPVDLVHVLKLDNKRTGLEAFGSETTLAVWIHLPSEEKNVSPKKNIKLEEKVEKKLRTSKSSLKFDQTFNTLIKEEKDCDFEDISKEGEIYFEEPLEEKTIINESNVIIDSENILFCDESEQDHQITIKEEPLESLCDSQVIPNDNSSIIIYDGTIFNNIKTENDCEGYNVLINNSDSFVLSDLDPSLLDGTANPDLLSNNFTVTSGDTSPVYNVVSVVSTLPNHSFNAGENISYIIKTEADSPPRETVVTTTPTNSDEFLDECNIVESEVVIDCDEDPIMIQRPSDDKKIPDKLKLTSKENSSKLITTSNNFENKPMKNIKQKSIIPKPSCSVVSLSDKKPVGKSGKLVSQQSSTQATKASKKTNSPSIVDKKKILPSEILIVNQNIVPQTTLQEVNSSGFINVSDFQLLDQNIKIIKPAVKKTKFMDPKSIVSSQKTDKGGQLNSIEITDNGKTLAAGVVPIVKLVDNSVCVSSKSTPRKVIVRKLNGEVATILAPVSPEALPTSVKLAAASQGRVIKNTHPVTILPHTSGSTYKVLKNVVGSPVKSLSIPVVATSMGSLNLQQSKPLVLETPLTTLPSSSLSTATKNKRRNNTNKELKSTLIMLQKENGEVILKKEAKFSDCKDESPASGIKNLSKVIFAGTAPSNKKGHGKEISGDLNFKSILPIVESNKNNMNPSSVIKLQPTTSTYRSVLKKSVVPGVVGGRKIHDKNSMKLISVLNAPSFQNSSLLKSDVMKQTNYRNFPKDFKNSLLSKCPTQSIEVAVSWLMKKLPLFDPKARLHSFKCIHPYCAASREEFLNWPFGKQRAAEWARARHVVKLVAELNAVVEKWSTLQVYDWARIRAFTPFNSSNENIEEDDLSDAEISYFYSQPTSEIVDYIKKCKDLKENEEVDLLSIEEFATVKKSGTTTLESTDNREPNLDLPPAKGALFEPELLGMKKFVEKCQRSVGGVSSPETIFPGVSYSAADRLLISAFHSVAEDIIRRSFNASWIRHNEKYPSAINVNDVKSAVLSRAELDFLVPMKVEKRERPPMSVLPNFS